MTEKENEQVRDVDNHEESHAEGLSSEIANQLDDFVKAKKIVAGSEESGANSMGRAAEAILNNGAESMLDRISIGKFHVSDKEREGAVADLGKGLASMQKQDLEYLRSRMQELGLSTAELDKRIDAAEKQAKEAQPLQDAALRGDTAALQKLVANTDPQKMAEMVDLINKNFDKSGVGLELDFSNGNLILSATHGDRAVLISKDKTDVIGINKDGSYDFNRQYRRENPGQELKNMTNEALADYLNPRRYWKEPHWGGGIGGGGGFIDKIRPTNQLGNKIVEEFKKK